MCFIMVCTIQHYWFSIVAPTHFIRFDWENRMHSAPKRRKNQKNEIKLHNQPTLFCNMRTWSAFSVCCSVPCSTIIKQMTKICMREIRYIFGISNIIKKLLFKNLHAYHLLFRLLFKLGLSECRPNNQLTNQSDKRILTGSIEINNIYIFLSNLMVRLWFANFHSARAGSSVQRKLFINSYSLRFE